MVAPAANTAQESKYPSVMLRTVLLSTRFEDGKVGKSFGIRTPSGRKTRTCKPTLTPGTLFHTRNSRRNSVPGVNVGLHRSEEHTSELQSLRHLVCRLLLEKKKRL